MDFSFSFSSPFNFPLFTHRPNTGKATEQPSSPRRDPQVLCLLVSCPPITVLCFIMVLIPHRTVEADMKSLVGEENGNGAAVDVEVGLDEVLEVIAEMPKEPDTNEGGESLVLSHDDYGLPEQIPEST